MNLSDKKKAGQAEQRKPHQILENHREARKDLGAISWKKYYLGQI